VLQIIEAAGWPIWPIIIASIIALGIIGERFWSLRTNQIVPDGLLPEVVQELKQKGVNPDMLNRLTKGPLLAQVFAAGLRNMSSSREVMK
jgi:biopolymer transport protein ExbB